MDIEMISLSQLQTDPQSLLSKCCNSGRPIVVELPDHRLVAIQSIEPDDSNDSRVSDLLESNPSFRALVEKSKTGSRRKFTTRIDD
jgi:hypothetical protein